MRADHRDLTDEVLLVTGGASGLGRATAQALAARGAAVVLVDLAATAPEVAESVAAASGVAARAVVGDVRDDAVLTEAVRVAAGLGRLTMVHANAGVDPVDAGSVLDTTPERWEFVLSVNLDAAVRLARAALPTLIANGGGRVVLTSSVAGLSAAADESAYTVSKAALIALARSITRDFGPQGVRANAVCPGPLEAIMTDRRASLSETERADRRTQVSASVPLGREGGYGEVADAVAFLLGPESAYVAGTSLVVDGGMLA